MANFFFKLAGWLILTTLAALLFSTVATHIWAWFLVPAFHFAPLHYKAALGLGYFCQLMTVKLPEKTMTDFPVWALPLVSMFVYLTFFAISGIAYLVFP